MRPGSVPLQRLHSDGNMNAEIYAESRGSDYTLMHDNTRSQQARRTREYLAMGNIRELSWPAQSPPRHLIEYVWDMI